MANERSWLFIIYSLIVSIKLLFNLQYPTCLMTSFPSPQVN